MPGCLVAQGGSDAFIGMIGLGVVEAGQVALLTGGRQNVLMRLVLGIGVWVGGDPCIRVPYVGVSVRCILGMHQSYRVEG